MERDKQLAIFTQSIATRQEPVMPQKMSRADKYMSVASMVHQAYDIIKVLNPYSFWYKEPEGKYYIRLDDNTLMNWVRDAYLSGFGTAEPKELAESAKMIKIMTIREVSEVDNSIIYIGGSKYWDSDVGSLTDDIGDKFCFRRLFDTSFGDKHVVKVPEFEQSHIDHLINTYNEVLDELEQGVFNERYEFIKTWANGSHDVYMDMIRAVSYCFLKKKPVGSYILVGLRRNGKSSFVGMLHTIFGRNNTSMVRLSQLGDGHYVNSINGSMLNAPDEEDEKAVDAQANFKTMADHGILNLSVMRENHPITVKCDFMCFYPMNHLPEWKGTGAAACMKRSLVIPFYADLSEFDKKNYNFEEETFNRETLSDFLGSVFAYATYYSSREHEFSDSMRKEQEVLEEEADSGITYRRLFEKYFDGFDSINTLYIDYVNWCKTIDAKISSKKEIKFIFRDYMTSRQSVTPNKGMHIKGYRIPQANHNFMHMGLFLKDLNMSIDTLHERNCSIVERMDTFYTDKIGEV